MSIDANLMDLVILQNVTADPKISAFLQKSLLPLRVKKDLSPKELELLCSDSEESETDFT